jgi:hypothetical protein
MATRLEAIKSNGGIAVVRDPISAEFDGIQKRCGYWLCRPDSSPDMMPGELLEFSKEAPLIRSFNISNQKDEAILYSILTWHTK